MYRYMEQYAHALHICMHVYMYIIGMVNKKKHPAVCVTLFIPRGSCKSGSSIKSAQMVHASSMSSM